MTDNTADVKALLENAMSNVERLLGVLKSEYSALERNDLEAFEKAVLQKIDYANDIEAIELSIFEKIKIAGFQSSRQGFIKYIRTIGSQGETQELLPLWERLHLMTKHCHEQNQTNGRIVNIASITTQQALNMLTGRDVTTGIYDPSGKSDDDADRNPLAIA